MNRAIWLVPLCAAACKHEIDSGRLAAQIKSSLAAQHLALAALACPTGREAKAGDTFTCTGTSIDGQTVKVAVTQHDAGNIQWVLDGMILETARIESDVLPKLGDGITLQCPRTVTVTAVGDVTTCKFTAKDGQIGKLDITSDDAEGNISYKVEK